MLARPRWQSFKDTTKIEAFLGSYSLYGFCLDGLLPHPPWQRAPATLKGLLHSVCWKLSLGFFFFPLFSIESNLLLESNLQLSYVESPFVKLTRETCFAPSHSDAKVEAHVCFFDFGSVLCSCAPQTIHFYVALVRGAVSLPFISLLPREFNVEVAVSSQQKKPTEVEGVQSRQDHTFIWEKPPHGKHLFPSLQFYFSNMFNIFKNVKHNTFVCLLRGRHSS